MRSVADRYRDLFPGIVGDSVLDPTTGAWRHAFTELTPSAVDVYRFQPGARSGATDLNWATELNNSRTAAGTLVWMRHKDEPGQILYEFTCGCPSCCCQPCYEGVEITGPALAWVDAAGDWAAVDLTGQTGTVIVTAGVPSVGPAAGTVTSIAAGTGIVCTPDPITGSGTVAADVGTSGHKLPFLDGDNTWSGNNTFPAVGFRVTDFVTPANTLAFVATGATTASRSLSYNVNDANRVVSLSGNLTVPSAATVSGVNSGDQDLSPYLTVASAAATYQPLDADLSALAALAATAGVLSRTGAGAFAARTLAAPAAGLTITNPTGAAGDPTFALADDLAALEALSGTSTIYYRSGASAWSAVTVGAGLSFSGGTLTASTATALTTTLGSTFTLSASAGTWEDVTGLSVTLPAAGTYLVTWDLYGNIGNSSGTFPRIFGRLDLNGSALANSEGIVVQGTGTTGTWALSGSRTMVVTAAGAHVLKVQAVRNITGGGTITASTIVSDTNGRSALTYCRIY